MVDVGVDFAHIVKVTVRRALLRQKLFVRVEHDVQVELLFQQAQAVVGVRFDGAGGRDF